MIYFLRNQLKGFYVYSEDMAKEIRSINMQNTIFVVSWVVMLSALGTYAYLYRFKESAPFNAKLALLAVQYSCQWIWDLNFILAHARIFRRSKQIQAYLDEEL